MCAATHDTHCPDLAWCAEAPIWVQNISPLVITKCHQDRCLAIELTFLPKLPPKISPQMQAILPVFIMLLLGARESLQFSASWPNEPGRKNLKHLLQTIPTCSPFSAWNVKAVLPLCKKHITVSALNTPLLAWLRAWAQWFTTTLLSSLSLAMV